MEDGDSDSDSKYEVRNTQINDDLWDEYSSTEELDDKEDKSYGSDEAAELLKSRFALSRSDNNEHHTSSDEDAESNNKDDKALNTKVSATEKKVNKSLTSQQILSFSEQFSNVVALIDNFHQSNKTKGRSKIQKRTKETNIPHAWRKI
eukprot:3315896-Ditylum_brightwellii.AAC.1